jgi:zinc D-Ala-D-Ala carboxypeptidase
MTNTPTLKLSPHFSLAELTTTAQNISNTPTSPIILDNLRSVCVNVLEPVREHFSHSITVHSGYRSPAINKAVGGSDRSQHMKGEAVDFHVNGLTVYDVAIWISDNMEYDQLILENFIPGNKTSGWVHCSFSKGNRNQDLTKFKGSKTYYAGIVLQPEKSLPPPAPLEERGGRNPFLKLSRADQGGGKSSTTP